MASLELELLRNGSFRSGCVPKCGGGIHATKWFVHSRSCCSFTWRSGTPYCLALGSKSGASSPDLSRLVKKLERLELVWLRILRRLSVWWASPTQRQQLQSCLHEVIDYRGIQDAWGEPARLCERSSESRTPVAKRISGCGEPDPEKSDQGSIAAFGRRKGRHRPRSLTGWVEWYLRTWRRWPSPIRFWDGIRSSSRTNLMGRNSVEVQGAQK